VKRQIRILNHLCTHKPHDLLEEPVNPEEDLTERQKTVLKLMTDGFTNAEIARELLLSESSIRQETVRIYKTLGVSSRQGAAKKGKALGLIARP
jgi:DNA-binding NarL/FixJ family response regulator